MKQFMKTILCSLALISLVGLMQCGKPTNPQITVNNQLIGQWQWVSSIGGMTGWEKRTPEKNGYNIILNFKADSTYTETRIDSTGSVIYDGTYYIVYKQIDFISAIDSGNVIYFSGDIESFVEISGNTLGLTNLFPDGFGSSYIKIED